MALTSCGKPDFGEDYASIREAGFVPIALSTCDEMRDVTEISGTELYVDGDFQQTSWLAGKTVDEGPFTFNLWLFCQEPTDPDWLNSTVKDIDHSAILMTYLRFDFINQDVNGPLKVRWGAGKNVHYSVVDSNLTLTPKTVMSIGTASLREQSFDGLNHLSIRVIDGENQYDIDFAYRLEAVDGAYIPVVVEF
jgi:hypothetical protein